jgi:large subunit ribosomal protein L15
MILNDVHQGIKKRKARKRIGRGPGSGHGKTSTRGHKGDGSRSGNRSRRGFEGGQTPLFMRVAKRGFNNNAFAPKVAAINVAILEAKFNNGDEVSPETLRARSVLKGNYDLLKILGNGDLTKKLTVKAHRFSQSAQEKITKAGGTAELIF